MRPGRPAARPSPVLRLPARPSPAPRLPGGGESFTDMVAREKREREISMALAGEERRKRHAKEEHQKQLQQRQQQQQPQQQPQRQHTATAAVAAAAIAALPLPEFRKSPQHFHFRIPEIPDSLEYYNCVICLQLCIEPARLKCNHAEMICKQCVYDDVKARKEKANCPQCRESYEGPLGQNWRELETDRRAWFEIKLKFPELVADRQRQLAEARREVAQQQQRRAGAPAARRVAAATLPPRAADANGRFMM